jgi:hypothetical protein
MGRHPLSEIKTRWIQFPAGLGRAAAVREQVGRLSEEGRIGDWDHVTGMLIGFSNVITL